MEPHDIQNRIAELRKEEARLLAMLDDSELADWRPLQVARLNANECLECGEPYESGTDTRGNHSACYHRIYRRIRDNEFTLTEAETVRGLLAPKKKTGRKRIPGTSSQQPVSQVSKKKALPQIPGVAVTSAAELAEAEAEAAAREARDRETTQSANRPARTPRKQRKKAAKPPAKKVDTDDKRKQA